MKALGGSVSALVVGALVLAAVAPSLIALASALVPLVLVLGAVAVAVRLAFFNTRRW